MSVIGKYAKTSATGAVGAILILLLGLASANTGRPGEADTAPPGSTAPPNVVMVVLDDLDAQSDYLDVMPETAALLREGTRFTNAFAPTPICCAARASLLTGDYGHNTGVLTNSGEQGGWQTFVENGNEDATFAVDLQTAGYRTGLAGKYLNGIEDDPTHVPPGWDEWYASVDTNIFTGYDYQLNENGSLVSYGADAADYSTDVLSAKSVDFIERAADAGDQPFLWSVNPAAPHYPLPPAPRHTDHEFADSTAPQPPNSDEADVSDKPTWLQESAEQRSSILSRVIDDDYRNRMGSLLAVDDMVGDIVDTLERTGELDNTLMVFMSDNGYNLGAHRLWQKMAPYEESLRVPMAVTGPGVVAQADEHMVLMTDLAPTLLDLAGVAPDSGMDGESLVPLLRGEATDVWRQDFIAQYVSDGETTEDGVAQEMPAQATAAAALDIPAWRAVRTMSHAYIEWQDGSGDRELYDLAADPSQLDNLLATESGRTENEEFVGQLADRLEQLSTCSGVTCF